MSLRIIFFLRNCIVSNIAYKKLIMRLKIKILFFCRKNCKYSNLMIQNLKKRNLDLKIIYSKYREEKLKKIKWTGDYIICFRTLYILNKSLLNRATIAAINFHPAPRWYRGSGGINWAVYNNDKSFGATVHLMNEKIDNGPIIHASNFPILKNYNYVSIQRRAYLESIKVFKRIITGLLKNHQIYLNRKINYCKMKKIIWKGRVRKINEIDYMQKIKFNYSKEKIKKIIKATNIKDYPVYIDLHGYKFEFKLK